MFDADRGQGSTFEHKLRRTTRIQFLATRFGRPLCAVIPAVESSLDSRQVATALEIGSSLADEMGGQYIVLMNSDEFEKLEFNKDVDIASKLLPVTIDDTKEGGLFGFKFG
ncbi:DUF2326 domain-containing protein [Pararhizobium sp. LjRoot235]|uniref:DUF2326 domain-containing protein n=1 Tax=Pararhizobium sp. LjRoot235 TaxID=3342291 RepID=UPI003ECE985B